MAEVTKPTSTQTTFSHEAMWEKDKAAKDKMKMQTSADQRRKSQKSLIKIGDSNRQTENKKQTRHPLRYDMKPFIVKAKKGSMVTANREGKRITQNSSHFRIISPQPNAEVEDQDYDLPGASAEPSPPDKDTIISQPDESPTARRYPTRSKISPQHFQDCHNNVKQNSTRFI